MGDKLTGAMAKLNLETLRGLLTDMTYAIGRGGALSRSKAESVRVTRLLGNTYSV